MAKMSFDEKKWLAESDAHVIASYQEIMNDSKRKNAALKAAKQLVEELTKRVNTMKKAFGGKLKK